jgi:hypothetical protein
LTGTCLIRNLGENISSIELDIPSLTDQQTADLETAVNEKILASVPVTPHLYHDKEDPELLKVKDGRMLRLLVKMLRTTQNY